jgi:hypothetical protein
MKKRTLIDLTHQHLLSGDMGELLPVGCVEVLMGDSFKGRSDLFVRVTPQLKPVMHKVDITVAHFFVPNRILWTGWEDFITGESATAPPTISGATHSSGSLQDYLGVYDDTSNDYSALPIRAYNMIYNHNFRDEDLVSEVSEDSTSIQKVGWQKDYFVGARPWAVKGTAVTLPIGTEAPVYSDQGATAYNLSVEDNLGNEQFIDAGGTYANLSATAASGSRGQLKVDLSSATGLDIIEFREALAKQRYQEARARYGSEYVDYLRYYGINPADQRMQKPEFLGASTNSIMFSEVLQTSNDGTNGEVGEMYGHGISAMRSQTYKRFFQEHGWVISLAYVRPKPIYVQGLHRKFSRTTKEDYFQEELQSVGSQEILNKELYALHASPDDTFGFTPRYSEYLSEPSRVSAEFRDSTSYDWHFGRIFGSDPALNQAFIECDPTKRCFADQSNHSLWITCQNRIKARRLPRWQVVGRTL